MDKKGVVFATKKDINFLIKKPQRYGLSLDNSLMQSNINDFSPTDSGGKSDFRKDSFPSPDNLHSSYTSGLESEAGLHYSQDDSFEKEKILKDEDFEKGRITYTSNQKNDFSHQNRDQQSPVDRFNIRDIDFKRDSERTPQARPNKTHYWNKFQTPEFKKITLTEREHRDSQNNKHGSFLVRENLQDHKDEDKSVKRIKSAEKSSIKNFKYLRLNLKKDENLYTKKALKRSEKIAKKREIRIVEERKVKSEKRTSEKKEEPEKRILNLLSIFEVFSWFFSADIMVRFIIGLIAGVVVFFLIFSQLGIFNAL